MNGDDQTSTDDLKRFEEFRMKEQVDSYLEKKLRGWITFAKYLSAAIVALLTAFGFEQYLSIDKFRALENKVTEAQVLVNRLETQNRTIENALAESRGELAEIPKTIQQLSALHTQLMQEAITINSVAAEVEQKRGEILGIQSKVSDASKEIDKHARTVEEISGRANGIIETLTLQAERVETLEDISQDLAALGTRLFRATATQTFVLRRDQISFPIRLPDIENQTTEQYYDFEFSLSSIAKLSVVNCKYRAPADTADRTVELPVRAQEKFASTREQVFQIPNTPFELAVDYVNNDWIGNDFMMLSIRAARDRI